MAPGLGEEQAGDALDIRRYPAPFGHDHWQRGKSAVEQHEFSGSSGSRGGRPHGNAEIGQLESQHIVDAVTGHGDCMPACLQGFDHGLLLVRSDPAEDRAFLEQAAKRGTVLRQTPRVYRISDQRDTALGSDGVHGARAVS